MEAGAFDGATDSTSLLFEIAHKWSGLLVEPVSRWDFLNLSVKNLLQFEVLCEDSGERPTGLVNQDLPINDDQTSNN